MEVLKTFLFPAAAAATSGGGGDRILDLIDRNST